MAAALKGCFRGASRVLPQQRIGVEEGGARLLQGAPRRGGLRAGNARAATCYPTLPCRLTLERRRQAPGREHGAHGSGGLRTRWRRRRRRWPPRGGAGRGVEQRALGQWPVGSRPQAQGLGGQLQLIAKRQSPAALLREPRCTQPGRACRPRRTRPCRFCRSAQLVVPQRQRTLDLPAMLLPLLGLVHLGDTAHCRAVCRLSSGLLQVDQRTLAWQ